MRGVRSVVWRCLCERTTGCVCAEMLFPPQRRANGAVPKPPLSYRLIAPPSRPLDGCFVPARATFRPAILSAISNPSGTVLLYVTGHWKHLPTASRTTLEVQHRLLSRAYVPLRTWQRQLTSQLSYESRALGNGETERF